MDLSDGLTEGRCGCNWVRGVVLGWPGVGQVDR